MFGVWHDELQVADAWSPSQKQGIGFAEGDPGHRRRHTLLNE